MHSNQACQHQPQSFQFKSRGRLRSDLLKTEDHVMRMRWSQVIPNPTGLFQKPRATPWE